jgi:hypothetical protein
VRAAWFLRSRQMLLSIRFWLAITGYDSKDESLSNRLLLGYIVVFFGVWGLAVLALITSGVSQGLLMISPTQPVHAAYLVSLAAVTGWSLSHALQRGGCRPGLLYPGLTPGGGILLAAGPMVHHRGAVLGDGGRLRLLFRRDRGWSG